MQRFQLAIESDTADRRQRSRCRCGFRSGCARCQRAEREECDECVIRLVAFSHSVRGVRDGRVAVAEWYPLDSRENDRRLARGEHRCFERLAAIAQQRDARDGRSGPSRAGVPNGHFHAGRRLAVNEGLLRIIDAIDDEVWLDEVCDVLTRYLLRSS